MKEYVYVVAWVIATIVPDSCGSTPQEDEFGIANNTYTSCAVYHTRVELTEKTKEFKVKDSALAFIKRAKEKYKKSNRNGFYISGSSTIKTITLDSISK